jgi:cyclopropane fatty-acyl-phospholipid synthase-like methyltransferase
VAAAPKPFSEACERNQAPILSVLREVFADRTRVLEIGSGTGQHAVHFARALPHLVWQASDVAQHLAGIGAWRAEAALANLPEPIELDLNSDPWPSVAADAVFTANTLHIVSWPEVQTLFERVSRILPPRGVLAVYGPFNYAGRYTAQSNAQFDSMLRSRDPGSGIRDFEAVDALAAAQGLVLERDVAMPANNRSLVWVRK